MIKKLFKKENILYLVMFILLFLVHLPLLTKNILTADVLLNNSFYNGYQWEISLGRYGLFIIGLLKGYMSYPIIEIILSFIILLVITYLLIDLFDIKNIINKTFSILLMVLSPIVSATLLFHYCSVPYFLAFLGSILSVYLYYKSKNKLLKYVLPVILITISLSFYQAYLSVMVTTFFLYQIKLLFDKKINYKESFFYLVLLLIGLIIYFIGMKLSLIVFHIDMASYSNANSIGLSALLDIPNKFTQSYKLFFSMFFTNTFTKNTYLKNNYIYGFLFILFIICFGIKLFTNKNSLKEKIFIIILFLLIPVFLNSIIFVLVDSKLQLLMSASYLVFLIYIISMMNDKVFNTMFFVLLIVLFRNYLIQVEATYVTLENTYKAYDTVIRGAINNNYDKKFIVIGEIKNKDKDITDKNYGYISDEGIFWDEYNLRKLGFERFCKQNYGLDITFGDEDIYNNIDPNNNKVVYGYDDNIIINLNNIK